MLITIIGSGNSGLAMASHLALAGHEVRLWNRTRETMGKMVDTRKVYTEGVISGEAQLSMVTSDISEALRGCKMIFITTPASAHAYLAHEMAPYLEPDAAVILNPGRTFGAIEYYNILKELRPDLRIKIAETQTIIYTCRKLDVDRVNVLALKSDVLFSTFDASQNPAFLAELPEVLQPLLIPAISMVETSLGNVGMILHCTPMLLNVGRTESHASYHYYTEGITPSIARLLEKIDFERTNVAFRLGYHLESCEDWLKRTYKVTGDNLYECIQNNPAYQSIIAPTSMDYRYISEDIPYGLVPLEAAAKVLDVETPLVTMVIDLATHLLDHDFRGEGRSPGFLHVMTDPDSSLRVLFQENERNNGS